MPTPVTIEQHAERAVTEDAPEILARGMVAHVGFTIEEQPYVIPFAYHFEEAAPEHLYLHGGLSSRALLHLAQGAPVCVTVTLLDGLVYSRTALYHSMNYRSVVCFGKARTITEEGEKAMLFERMVDRYFPGRTIGRDYDAPPAEHLNATAVLAVHIESWSAKSRTGGPKGPRDQDSHASGTCGVLPL